MVFTVPSSSWMSGETLGLVHRTRRRWFHGVFIFSKTSSRLYGKRPIWHLETGGNVMAATHGLGFRGAMYDMTDVTWLTSSVSPSSSYLLLAHSSRHSRGEVRLGFLGVDVELQWCLALFVTHSWNHVLHLLLVVGCWETQVFYHPVCRACVVCRLRMCHVGDVQSSMSDGSFWHMDAKAPP
jgi:hypothetical protein